MRCIVYGYTDEPHVDSEATHFMIYDGTCFVAYCDKCHDEIINESCRWKSVDEEEWKRLKIVYGVLNE